MVYTKGIKSGNTIRNKAPQIIKYLKNEEDADKYSYKSAQKITFKCPECGEERNNLKIYSAVERGFNCQYCADGISIPEKFGINLFKQIGIEFETQYSPSWSKRYKYDFYIPSLNVIIETHGNQHYEEMNKYSKFARTLEEEKKNDLFKYNLAIVNSIKIEDYIVVNCRYSEFELLRENYFNSLSILFDLNNIDWDMIWMNSQKSVVSKVWDMWNNKDENDTAKTIAKELKISKEVCIRHLKKGNIIGKCSYNPKEEMIKGSTRRGLKNGIEVYQYSLDNKYLNKYPSNRNAEKITGINNAGISSCCNGKRKAVGGFKWSYFPPEEYLKSLEQSIDIYTDSVV